MAEEAALRVDDIYEIIQKSSKHAYIITIKLRFVKIIDIGTQGE